MIQVSDVHKVSHNWQPLIFVVFTRLQPQFWIRASQAEFKRTTDCLYLYDLYFRCLTKGVHLQFSTDLQLPPILSWQRGWAEFPTTATVCKKVVESNQTTYICQSAFENSSKVMREGGEDSLLCDTPYVINWKNISFNFSKSITFPSILYRASYLVRLNVKIKRDL